MGSIQHATPTTSPPGVREHTPLYTQNAMVALGRTLAEADARIVARLERRKYLEEKFSGDGCLLILQKLQKQIEMLAGTKDEDLPQLATSISVTAQHKITAFRDILAEAKEYVLIVQVDILALEKEAQLNKTLAQDFEEQLDLAYTDLKSTETNYAQLQEKFSRSWSRAWILQVFGLGVLLGLIFGAGSVSIEPQTFVAGVCVVANMLELSALYTFQSAFNFTMIVWNIKLSLPQLLIIFAAGGILWKSLKNVSGEINVTKVDASFASKTNANMGSINQPAMAARKQSNCLAMSTEAAAYNVRKTDNGIYLRTELEQALQEFYAVVQPSKDSAAIKKIVKRYTAPGLSKDDSCVRVRQLLAKLRDKYQADSDASKSLSKFSKCMCFALHGLNGADS